MGIGFASKLLPGYLVSQRTRLFTCYPDRKCAEYDDDLCYQAWANANFAQKARGGGIAGGRIWIVRSEW